MPRMLAMLCMTFLAAIEILFTPAGFLFLFFILWACGVFK